MLDLLSKQNNKPDVITAIHLYHTTLC